MDWWGYCQALILVRGDNVPLDGECQIQIQLWHDLIFHSGNSQSLLLIRAAVPLQDMCTIWYLQEQIPVVARNCGHCISWSSVICTMCYQKSLKMVTHTLVISHWGTTYLSTRVNLWRPLEGLADPDHSCTGNYGHVTASPFNPSVLWVVPVTSRVLSAILRADYHL